MTTTHVFIATSLDGYIARRSGAIDWLDRPEAAGEDHGYDTFIGGIDGIIMGRKTFQVVLGFDPWPYNKPLIVLSTTLTAQDVPPHLAQQITLARSVPEALSIGQRLNWKRAYLDGGSAIQAFLRDGLVDDMIITTIPILLGDGLPLFGAQTADIHLRHMETRAFPSGLVQSRYQVNR